LLFIRLSENEIDLFGEKNAIVVVVVVVNKSSPMYRNGACFELCACFPFYLFFDFRIMIIMITMMMMMLQILLFRILFFLFLALHEL